MKIMVKDSYDAATMDNDGSYVDVVSQKIDFMLFLSCFICGQTNRHW